MNIIAAQGEIRVYRVDRIPSDVRAFDQFDNNRPIIGHSETGHHHVLEAERVTVFEHNKAPAGMRVLYALLESPGELRHLRTFDTHDSIHLEAGVYCFRVDREFDHYNKLIRRSMD